MVSVTIAVMEQRLRSAQVVGRVRTDRSQIAVVVGNTAEVAVVKLLASEGIVTLRIYPNGDRYAPENQRPILHAKLGYDEGGQPAITLNIADPDSFRQFTSRHINQRLGIFLDRELVEAPDIDTPISDSAQITGNAKGMMSRVFVAIVNSGPLPVPLKLLK